MLVWSRDRAFESSCAASLVIEGFCVWHVAELAHQLLDVGRSPRPNAVSTAGATFWISQGLRSPYAFRLSRKITCSSFSTPSLSIASWSLKPRLTEICRNASTHQQNKPKRHESWPTLTQALQLARLKARECKDSSAGL